MNDKPEMSRRRARSMSDMLRALLLFGNWGHRVVVQIQQEPLDVNREIIRVIYSGGERYSLWITREDRGA